MFQPVPLSIIRTFSLSNRNRTELVPSWSCSQAVSKPVWHIPLLCVQWKTPDGGQSNWPKYVEFYPRNKFWEISAYSWFCYMTLSRCTVSWISNCLCIFTRTSEIIIVIFLVEGEGKHKFLYHFESVAVWQNLRSPDFANEFVSYMPG